jgi:hypothetical protein
MDKSRLFFRPESSIAACYTYFFTSKVETSLDAVYIPNCVVFFLDKEGGFQINFSKNFDGGGKLVKDFHEFTRYCIRNILEHGMNKKFYQFKDDENGSLWEVINE